MEDAVYICKWKKTPSGFRLWMKGSPKVFVEGHDDFFVLSEQLSEVITNNGGAQHAVLEFSPAPPVSAYDAKFSKVPLVSLCGSNETFSIADVNVDPKTAPIFDQYFVKPTCLDCRTQSSPRNDKALDLENVKAACDGGWVPHFNRTIQVFSDLFIALLPKSERNLLDWREVNTPKRVKKRFFELVGPVDLKPVAVDSIEPTGWECKSCGFKTFGYWSEKTDFKSFVAESLVVDPKRSIFVLDSNSPELCMKLECWQKLVGKKGTKGISSTPIGTTPKSEISKKLSLPSHADLDWGW